MTNGLGKRRSLTTCAVALAVFCWVFAANGADRIEALSKFQRGDQLEIHFASSGCFSSSQYDLIVTAEAEPSATTPTLKLKWGSTNGLAPTAQPAGTNEVRLSQNEVEGLNKLLRSYRTSREFYGTFSDQVTLRQLRGGVPIATEHFENRSFRVASVKGVLTIPELADKLKALSTSQKP